MSKQKTLLGRMVRTLPFQRCHWGPISQSKMLTFLIFTPACQYWRVLTVNVDSGDDITDRTVRQTIFRLTIHKCRMLNCFDHVSLTRHDYAVCSIRSVR